MARPGSIGTVVQISMSTGGVPKRAVERANLDVDGLEGDRHNDRANHGGPDRALCLFSMEVIEVLQEEGHHVYPGAIGENVTIRGIEWAQVSPGDRLRIGPALVEITRFTTPCKNIASAFRDRDISRVLHSKHPGQSRVYARVLEPGELSPGLPVEHIRSQSKVRPR
jgi:MOSC domain-containing protein YiiM